MSSSLLFSSFRLCFWWRVKSAPVVLSKTPNKGYIPYTGELHFVWSLDFVPFVVPNSLGVIVLGCT